MQHRNRKTPLPVTVSIAVEVATPLSLLAVQMYSPLCSTIVFSSCSITVPSSEYAIVTAGPANTTKRP